MIKRRKKKVSAFKRPIIFWLTLLLCFPLGLFMLWKHKPYGIIGRSIITFVTSFIIFSIPFGYYFYHEYEQQQLTKQAEIQELEATHPGMVYTANGFFTPEQLAFADFYKNLQHEMDIYKQVALQYNMLVESNQNNSGATPSVSAAYIDSFKRRLHQSKERVQQLTVPDCPPEEKAILDKSLKDYIQFLSDTEVAYMLMQTSLLRSDPASSQHSEKFLSESKNNFNTIDQNLKTIAEVMQLKPTAEGQNSTATIIEEPTTTSAPQNLYQVSNTSPNMVKPPMPQSAEAVPSQNSNARITASNIPQQGSISIGGQLLQGDIVSIYD